MPTPEQIEQYKIPEYTAYCHKCGEWLWHETTKYWMESELGRQFMEAQAKDNKKRMQEIVELERSVDWRKYVRDSDRPN